jgi:hypothetical protein
MSPKRHLLRDISVSSSLEEGAMSKDNKRCAGRRKFSAINSHRSEAEDARSARPVLLYQAGRSQVLFLGDPALSERIEVHTLVEDTLTSLPWYLRQEYSIAIEPFATSQGRCVVLQDLQGSRLCILDRATASGRAV